MEYARKASSDLKMAQSTGAVFWKIFFMVKVLSKSLVGGFLLLNGKVAISKEK